MFRDWHLTLSCRCDGISLVTDKNRSTKEAQKWQNVSHQKPSKPMSPSSPRVECMPQFNVLQAYRKLTFYALRTQFRRFENCLKLSREMEPSIHAVYDLGHYFWTKGQPWPHQFLLKDNSSPSRFLWLVGTIYLRRWRAVGGLGLAGLFRVMLHCYW